MKYVIFGDVAGHYKPLIKGLKEVGVDCKNFVIPDDVTIVQVGDLVHKGPNSLRVLQFIDKLMRKNPGKWKQLYGNHELPYVSMHPFFYPDRIEEPASAILRQWTYDDLIKPSFAFTDSSGRDYLVTHAGLTRSNYLLVGQGSAFDVSEALNGMSLANLSASGAMLDGSRPNNYAGIFWAEIASELYASWYKAPEQAPFNQIHGHCSLRQWQRGGLLRFNYAPWIMDNAEWDFDSSHSHWTSDGAVFSAIDHDLGRKSYKDPIHPMIVE